MGLNEEMASLLSSVQMDYWGNDTDHSRQVLADWLKDHHEMAAELFAEFLRQLPGVLMPLLKKHMAVHVFEETTYAGSRRIVTGFRVAIHWDGAEVTTARMDL